MYWDIPMDYERAILFYNPKSGQSRTDHQLNQVRSHLESHNIGFQFIEIPKPPAVVRQIVSEGIENGIDLFIAAGGDGSISLVADPLISTGKTLAILPLGTGNLIAKTLNIPIKLDKALELITSQEKDIIQLDVLLVDGKRYYISNVSVGISPKIMATTPQKEKQRIGFLAYIRNFLSQLIGLKLHRYYLEFDDQKTTFLATEILVTNGNLIGPPNMAWAENIAINDGVLDILVIRAKKFFDILKLALSIFKHQDGEDKIIRQYKFRDTCKITSKYPLPVQADGDVIGKTPVEIKLLPRALHVICHNTKIQENRISED
jgi:YegS/Rv2252/BmrU family lipid kinase